ncbi:hypothetical protein Ancab_002012 [Ancistrocladus abbreviatus]
MFEETVSVASFLASMNSWLTPTVLFVILNLMIGTIAVTSGFGSASTKPRENGTQHQDLSRQQTLQQLRLTNSPSVLQRLKSINFYSYRFHEPTITTTTTVMAPAEPPSSAGATPEQIPDLDTRLRKSHAPKEDISANVGEEVPTMDEVYGQIQGSFFGGSKSDTSPSAVEGYVKLPRNVKRSSSDVSAFKLSERDAVQEEERVVVERLLPATVREVENRVTADNIIGDPDADEVNAKADDFINRFRQQLKLQKMESIIRKKEMVSEGGDKQRIF